MTAATQPVAEDGNLPAALNRLEHAVHDLIEPQTLYVDGKAHHAPGPYLQLAAATSGAGEQCGGSRGWLSKPPVWIDAVQLLMEIDTAVEIMQPAFRGVPPTVGRLRCYVSRGWRPQDCRQIDQVSGNLEAWAKQIDALLNPKPVKHFSVPCPACGATRARRHKDGELVSVPALQVSAETGCTCLVCRYVWEPARFRLLAEVLGCSLPDGVLE